MVLIVVRTFFTPQFSLFELQQLDAGICREMKLPTKLRSLPVGRAGMPCPCSLLEVLWELAITCCNWLCSFSQTPIPPFIQSAWLPHTQLQPLLLTLLGVPITNISFNPSSHVSGRPGETTKSKRNASLRFQTSVPCLWLTLVYHLPSSVCQSFRWG